MTDKVEVTQSEEVLRKMLETAQASLTSCERMIELLQPEWDRCESKSGRNLYVARDYADYILAACRHRKEITALDDALSRIAHTEKLIEALRSALEEIWSERHSHQDRASFEKEFASEIAALSLIPGGSDAKQL